MAGRVSRKAPRKRGAGSRKVPVRTYRMSHKATAAIVKRALAAELQATLDAFDRTVEHIEDGVRKATPFNGDKIRHMMSHVKGNMLPRLNRLRDVAHLANRIDTPLRQVGTWLGWLQGGAGALGYCTIEDVAAINRRINGPHMGG